MENQAGRNRTEPYSEAIGCRSPPALYRSLDRLRLLSVALSPRVLRRSEWANDRRQLRHPCLEEPEKKKRWGFKKIQVSREAPPFSEIEVDSSKFERILELERNTRSQPFISIWTVDLGNDDCWKSSLPSLNCDWTVDNPLAFHRALSSEAARCGFSNLISQSSKPAGNDAIGVDLATKNENPKCPTPLGSYHTLEIIHEATPEEIKSETNDLWGRKIPPNERKVMNNIHEASPEELKLLWPRAEYAIDGNRRSKIPTPLSSYHTLENIREATPEEIKSETNDLWGRKIPPNERKVMDNIHEASPEELKLLWPRAEYAIDGNRRSKIPTPLSSYHTLENIREATPEEIKSETNDLWGRKIPPNERKVMDNIHEASPEELKLSGLMTTSVVKSSSLTGRKVHGIWK
ncbi:hypothetical protein ACFE04_004142 [Oxalis oulophora]